MPRRSHSFVSKRGVRCFQQPYHENGELKYTNKWYCRRQKGKREHQFALGGDKKLAGEVADEIWLFLQHPRHSMEECVAMFRPVGQAKPAAASEVDEVTLIEIAEEYIRGCHHWKVSPRVAKDNVYSFWKLVRAGLAVAKGEKLVLRPGKKTDLTPYEKLPVSTLTRLLVKNFKAWAVDEAKTTDQLISAQISADTCMTGARTIFNPRALQHYADCKLKLPDLTDFLTPNYFDTERKYMLPTAQVMEAVFKGGLALADEDPAMHRLFFMCKHWGLRSAEAQHVRPEHVEMLGVQTVELAGGGTKKIDLCQLRAMNEGSSRTKSGLDRTARREAWVWKIMQQWPKQPDGTVVGATDDVVDRLNKRLRKLAGYPDRIMPTHQFRKWWICWKAVNESIFVASREVGHSDLKTTTDSYGDCHFPEQLRKYYEDPKYA